MTEFDSGIRIPLTKGKHTWIDLADYEKVSEFRWHVQQHGHICYAVRRDKLTGESIFLHNFLMNPLEGYVIDHADRDGLNNRRDNLRYATDSQNNCNIGRKIGVSGFRGVYPHREKWAAHITFCGTTVCLPDKKQQRKLQGYEMSQPRCYMDNSPC